MAGDFVSQDRPSEKPRRSDKSKRPNLANKRLIKRERTPKNESRLSGRAMRSKKKEKGNKMYIKLGVRETKK